MSFAPRIVGWRTPRRCVRATGDTRYVYRIFGWSDHTSSALWYRGLVTTVCLQNYGFESSQILSMMPDKCFVECHMILACMIVAGCPNLEGTVQQYGVYVGWGDAERWASPALWDT